MEAYFVGVGLPLNAGGRYGVAVRHDHRTRTFPCS
jgi:hypothetical protein